MSGLQKFDIIIVGAGLVGSSMVVALQNQGLKIAVLETHLPDFTKKDMRPLSLSYGSVVILKTLGVWSDLQKTACPIKAVHVSNQGAMGAIHFSALEQEVPALGYVVSFSQLHSVLYHRAVTQTNVTIIAIKEICHIECDVTQTVVTVTTSEGKCSYETSLLVAADGANSTTRKLLNIATNECDHSDVALTAEVRLTQPHRNIAYERFTRDGTLALLPMFNHHYCRLVWSLDKRIADEVITWEDKKFHNYIQTCFAHRLPPIKAIQRGAIFPLKIILAREQVRPGVALIGNAVHTIYPLAAQGFNLGLRDVAVLAEILVDALGTMKSLGDLMVLNNYVSWRLGDQKRVAHLTKNISNLFGLAFPLLDDIRGMGLFAVDLLLPIKKRLANQIMGLSGHLPRLARGIQL